MPEEVGEQLKVMIGRLGVWATVEDMQEYWQVLTAEGDLAAATCSVVAKVLRREAAALRTDLAAPITAPYCSLGLHRCVHRGARAHVSTLTLTPHRCRPTTYSPLCAA